MPGVPSSAVERRRRLRVRASCSRSTTTSCEASSIDAISQVAFQCSRLGGRPTARRCSIGRVDPRVERDQAALAEPARCGNCEQLPRAAAVMERSARREPHGSLTVLVPGAGAGRPDPASTLIPSTRWCPATSAYTSRLDVGCVWRRVAVVARGSVHRLRQQLSPRSLERSPDAARGSFSPCTGRTQISAWWNVEALAWLTRTTAGSRSPMTPAPDWTAFDWLIAPLDRATFLEEVWERRPQAIHRADPGYFCSLVGRADVDTIARDDPCAAGRGGPAAAASPPGPFPRRRAAAASRSSPTPTAAQTCISCIARMRPAGR